MNNTTDIKDFNTTDFKVYPNPASYYITIELPFNDSSSGEILSLNGKSVLQFELSSLTRVNINRLSGGLYIVVIHSQNDILRNKLILLK